MFSCASNLQNVIYLWKMGLAWKQNNSVVSVFLSVCRSPCQSFCFPFCPPPPDNASQSMSMGKMSMERWLMAKWRNTEKFVKNEIGYLSVYTSVGLWVIVCGRLHWLVAFYLCWSMCVFTFWRMQLVQCVFTRDVSWLSHRGTVSRHFLIQLLLCVVC